MNKYLGKETRVRGVGNHGVYYVEIDKNENGGGFLYAEEWLERI